MDCDTGSSSHRQMTLSPPCNYLISVCIASRASSRRGNPRGVAPTLLHPRGVVPTLLQARIQQAPRANCPGRPCDMHCTMSRTCLDIKETRSSRMWADAGDAGDFSSPQGLRCAPDSRVHALVVCYLQVAGSTRDSQPGLHTGVWNPKQAILQVANGNTVTGSLISISSKALTSN